MNTTPNESAAAEARRGSRGPLAVLLGAALLLTAGVIGASLGTVARAWAPAGAPSSARAPLSVSAPLSGWASEAPNGAARNVERRPEPPPLPERLSESSLYEHGDTKRIAPGNLLYVPQYPLWTDGAAKRRWISLPPGTRIDASNPDAWEFPPGTRFWKEFSFGGPVETRLIERLADGSHRYATYVWDADRRDAVRAPDSGVRDVAASANGQRHDVPPLGDCRACHEGRRSSPVLGFGAIQLSSDRDPLAPHREPVPADSVDLRELLRRELIANAPAELTERPPRVDAPSPTARAAAGYLFGNCSGCHNAEGPLSIVGLDFDQSVKPGSYRRMLESAVNTTSGFHLPGEEASVRVAPGDPRHSAVWFRISSRDPVSQMPPLGTEVVDTEAQRLIRRFIAEDLKHEKPRKRAAHDHPQ